MTTVPRDNAPHKDEPTREAAGVVYLLRGPHGGGVKIGFTFGLGMRLRAYPPGCELLHLIFADDPRKLEAHLHAVYSDKRITAEWFNLTDEELSALKACETDRHVYDSVAPPALTERLIFFVSPPMLHRLMGHAKRRKLDTNAFLRFALDQFMTREEGGR